MLAWIVGILLIVGAVGAGLLAMLAVGMADAAGRGYPLGRVWLFCLAVAAFGVAIIVWG
jgi:hypothetical protein